MDKSLAAEKRMCRNGNLEERNLVDSDYYIDESNGDIAEIFGVQGITKGKGRSSIMTMADNKFTLEDLYIGMEIKDKNQLSDIYDTWIMLVKSSDSDVYTVRFIGKETNAESDKLFAQGNVVCPVYNDSMELEGDIYYEE